MEQALALLLMLLLPCLSLALTINSCADLDNIRTNLDAAVVLAQDIDCVGVVFLPIGSFPGAPFTGTFDGQGHIIFNVDIDTPAQDNTGFFAYIEAPGQIMDLHFQAADVTGAHQTGIVAGFNNGTINGCCAGEVVAGSDDTGGLVGVNGPQGQITRTCTTGAASGNNRVSGCAGSNKGTIGQSYSFMSATGSADVSGFVARNTGTIEESYSAGPPSGSSNLAGFTAENTGQISESYWDTGSSGQPTSDGGAPRTSAQMIQAATFSTWPQNIWCFPLADHPRLRDVDGVTCPPMQTPPVTESNAPTHSPAPTQSTPQTPVPTHSQSPAQTSTPSPKPQTPSHSPTRSAREHSMSSTASPTPKAGGNSGTDNTAIALGVSITTAVLGLVGTWIYLGWKAKHKKEQFQYEKEQREHGRAMMEREKAAADSAGSTAA